MHTAHPRKSRRLYLLGLLIPLIWGVLIIANQYRNSKILHSPLRFNVLLKTNPAVVLSYDPVDSRFLLVAIPNDVALAVPFGYGSYRAESIWKLSELENKMSLPLQSAEDLLGVVIQGYLGTKDVQKISIDAALRPDLLHILGMRNVMKMKETNLSLFDRLVLSWIFAHSSTQDVTSVTLSVANGGLTKTQLPDNSAVLTPQENAVSALLVHMFEDESIREKSTTVAVFNATSTPRIGQKFARILVNYGANVIHLGNSPNSLKHCLIEGDETYKNSKLSIFMREYLKCDYNAKKSDSLAEIKVFVGDNFASRWPITQ